jgi:hypothetical protein
VRSDRLTAGVAASSAAPVAIPNVGGMPESVHQETLRRVSPRQLPASGWPFAGPWRPADGLSTAAGGRPEAAQPVAWRGLCRGP